MDGKLKKITTYAIISLTVILLESLAGFTALYTGLFYTEYDEEAAAETMLVIQETDPGYFTMLNDPSQPEYMEEFRRLHTIKGHMTLITVGSIIIGVSLITMIPVVMILMSVSSGVKKEKTDEAAEDTEKEEVEEDDESF